MKYKEMRIEDVSYSSIKRYKLKIVVDHILNEDEIKEIVRGRINGFKKQGVAAAVFYFYLKEV